MFTNDHIPSNGFMKASLAIVAAAPLVAIEHQVSYEKRVDRTHRQEENLPAARG
jgi:hypothetical protein